MSRQYSQIRFDLIWHWFRSTYSRDKDIERRSLMRLDNPSVIASLAELREFQFRDMPRRWGIIDRRREKIILYC